MTSDKRVTDAAKPLTDEEAEAAFMALMTMLDRTSGTPAATICSKDDGGVSMSLHFSADRARRLAMQSAATPKASEGLVEAMKAVFIAGHSEGWTGNQCRRDVQHVDAEKGWQLYVKHGALAKALSRPVLTDEEREEARAMAKRLRQADRSSVQRALGSGIFGEAADLIDRLTGDGHGDPG